MPLFARKPVLPDEHHDAWWAFLDCAQAIEAARRVLLGTLPTGRVEPSPVAVGVEAVANAIDDVQGWMPAWRLEDLEDEWQECVDALDEARSALHDVRQVAADTEELEELLEAVGDVVEPLDAFADAERAWRRRWRCPERS